MVPLSILDLAPIVEGETTADALFDATKNAGYPSSLKSGPATQ